MTQVRYVHRSTKNTESIAVLRLSLFLFPRPFLLPLFHSPVLLLVFFILVPHTRRSCVYSPLPSSSSLSPPPLLFLQWLFILDHTRVYKHKYTYECTRGTHTCAGYIHARSHLDRHTYETIVVAHVCVIYIYIYIHDANSRSKGEEGIRFSASTRVFWPRTRCAPICAPLRLYVVWNN